MRNIHQPDLLTRYRKRRFRQVMLAFALLPLIALALLVQYDVIVLDHLKDLFGQVFFGFVIVGIGFSLINWRCPACNKYLGRNLNPQGCNGCGTEFQA